MNIIQRFDSYSMAEIYVDENGEPPTGLKVVEDFACPTNAGRYIVTPDEPPAERLPNGETRYEIQHDTARSTG